MNDSPRPQSPRHRVSLPWLACAGVFLALLGGGIYHTAQEKFFYFWDNFAYHRATLESLTAFEEPGTSWAQHLRISMQSGFSQLFTVTLAPLMHWCGEGRLVFIGGIIAFYLLPCAAFCTALVHRMVPLRGWQWPAVFMTCATLPVFWRASLTGYPDIGGLCIALGAALLISRDIAFARWRTALTLGPLLAATFLFRRHLVYAVIPLMLVTSASALLRTWLQPRGKKPTALASLGVRLLTTAAIATAIIWAVAPNYFRELVGTNFRELYLPFTFPVAQAWATHIGYVGVFYWLCALTGLGWTLCHGGAERWLAGMILGYIALSLTIWVFYLRYLSVQYNLHFAIMVAVGCGLLVAQLFRTRRPLVASLLVLLATGLWLDRLDFARLLPASADRLLPARIVPLQNPDYAAIEELIRFLRETATAPRNNVLVVASSQTLNSDMLTVGESALFGRNNRHLVIMNGSHADTVQPYPLRDMLAADWLVLVTPFQHHLRVEDQGVVLSTYQCMTEKTPYSADWKKIDRHFPLSDGAVATVYRRIRPTSEQVEVDTARRVFQTVGLNDAWTGPFMIGLAATGAEYFDFRIVTPTGPDRSDIDFEQLRFRPEQNEIRLFVWLSGRENSIGGRIEGSAKRSVQIRASFHPDRSPAQELAPTHAAGPVPSGGTFGFRLPSVSGVLVLHFGRTEPLPEGAAWGVAIRPLTLVAP